MYDENNHDSTMDSPSQRSRSRSPVRRSRTRSRSPRDWKRSERGNQDRSSRGRDSKVRLYVSNIPYETRWQDLKDLFREKVGENVTYVELYDGPDGKPCGAGVIEVRGQDIAEKAIEMMHRHEVKGRMIVVREERDKDRIRHQKMGGGSTGSNSGAMGDMGGGGMGMGMGMGNNSLMGSGNMNMGGGGNMGGGNMGGGNMGGGGGGNVNLQVLNQLGIDVNNLTSQVFIANLDYKVTARKLKEIFRMAGTILQCELKVDKEGKSRGMGICRYEHPMEAVQSISMFNGQVLYDRIMSVRMDKMNDANVTPQDIPNKLPSGMKGVGMGLGTNGQPLMNLAQIANALSFNNMSSTMNNSGGMGNMGNMGGGNMGSGMGGMGGNMGGNMGNMGSGMGNQMGGSMGNQMGSMGGGLGNQGMGNMGTGMQSNMGMGGNSGFSDMGMNSSMGGNIGGSSMGGMGSNMGMGGGSMGGGMGGNMGMGGGGMGMGGGMSDTFSNNMSSLMGGGSMGGGGGMGGGGMGGGGMGGGGRGGSNMGEICSVFVRNLPFSCSWQTLKEKFRDCGDVKFAEIKMDNGRSKGCGTVRFSTPEDARRAVNLMNGARFEGRQVEVRLDK